MRQGACVDTSIVISAVQVELIHRTMVGGGTQITTLTRMLVNMADTYVSRLQQNWRAPPWSVLTDFCFGVLGDQGYHVLDP